MVTNVTYMYLLVESGGDYSDQWSNNICFYDSSEKAENIASQANEIVKLYREKHSDLYKDRIHPTREDPQWKEKIEAFCKLSQAVDHELRDKLNELIGLETKDNWFRYDCQFSVEHIPYL